MNSTEQPAVAGQVEPTVRRLRRYGRFSVPATWAHEFRTDLKRVMGQCIVFRAEMLYWSDTIEYMAASEHFREIAEGEIMPLYRWCFSDDGSMWAEEVDA